jgi:hypothetical protein
MKTNCFAPRSSDLTPLGFLLWGYVEDQMHSERMDTLVNSKHGILRQLQMLQRTCYSAFAKRRTISRMHAELQTTLNVTCFTPNNSSICTLKNPFRLMYKMLLTSSLYKYLLSFLSYRCRN